MNKQEYVSAVMFTQDLTQREAHVALCIAHGGGKPGSPGNYNFNTAGPIDLSDKYLALRAKRSTRQVSEIVNSLVEKGWLVAEKRRGRPDLYFLAVPTSEANLQGDEQEYLLTSEATLLGVTSEDSATSEDSDTNLRGFEHEPKRLSSYNKDVSISKNIDDVQIGGLAEELGQEAEDYLAHRPSGGGDELSSIKTQLTASWNTDTVTFARLVNERGQLETLDIYPIQTKTRDVEALGVDVAKMQSELDRREQRDSEAWDYDPAVWQAIRRDCHNASVMPDETHAAARVSKVMGFLHGRFPHV